MVHSTVSERTRQLDRKRKERSYWDPVRLLREISSPFPREMPGRFHIRGFHNNQTLHSKVIFTQLIRKIFYTFHTHQTCNRPPKLLYNKR